LIQVALQDEEVPSKSLCDHHPSPKPTHEQ
jgi:hypothetical protein